MPTSDSPPQLIKLHEPGELLSMIPYLLGFHPCDSLVLIGLRQQRVSVTTRIDLADIAERHAVEHLARALQKSGSDTVVAVIYDSQLAVHGRQRWLDLPERFSSICDELGITVLDALVVSQSRWWSMMCLSEECCPAEGRTLPGESSVAAAEATFAGLVALPDRQTMAAAIEPVDQARRDGLADHIARYENDAVDAILNGRDARRRRSVKRAMFATARKFEAAHPGQGPELADDGVAKFLVALSDIEMRDGIWLAIDQNRLDGRGLWQELARRAPAPYDAAPLFLFAWASWRSGNGTLASLAAQRALVSDPAYTAAQMLMSALAHGLDPRRTPRLKMPRSA